MVEKKKEYVVLARKWRPQTFDEVLGQEHVTTTLKNAITMDRIAHAYLYTGPRGIGKTTTARIMAKALNCDKGISITPCNECVSCKEIADGINLDVLEIDGASNRGIDQVRELRDNSKFMPVKGRFKIYIIDEVHMLTQEAFNALLKTLEEPPSHVKFFFATTEPQKVPDTILSRTQRFDLKRIADDIIKKHILFIAKKEEFTIEEPAAELIASYVNGGLRDAESILDQLISFCEGKITEKEVMGILGLCDRDRVFDLAEKMLERNIKESLVLINDIYKEGKDLAQFLTALIEQFRDLLLHKLVPEYTDFLVMDKIAAKKSTEETQDISEEILRRIIQILMRSEERMKYTQSMKTLFEITIVNAIKTLSEIPMSDIVALLDSKREIRPTQQTNEERKKPPVSEKKEAVISDEKQQVEKPVQQTEKKEEITEQPDKKTPEPIEKPEQVIELNQPEKEEEILEEVEELEELEENTEEEQERLAAPQEQISDKDVFWKKLLHKVSEEKNLLSVYLSSGKIKEKKDEEIIIFFSKGNKFQYESIKEQSNKKLIEKIVEEIEGKKVSITYLLGNEKTPEEKEIEKKEVFSAEELEANPMIQKALKEFDGKIVDMRRS